MSGALRGAAACLLGVALALPLPAQQAGFARFRLDPGAEIVAQVARDADGDGRAEVWMAVVDGGRRVVQGYVQQGEQGFPAAPTHRQTMSRAVVAWAVGDFLPDAGPELVLTTREAAYVQPFGGRPRKIHDAPMLFDLPAEDALPVLREVLDFDGDGLEELVLPTRDGYAILSGDGSVFASIPWPARIGRSPAAQQELLGGRARATVSSRALSDLFVPEENPGIIERPPLLYDSVRLPRPVLDDLDGDGRADFCFLDGDRLRVHLQGADGGFATVPDRLLTLPEAKAKDDEALRWGDFGGGPAADLLLVRSSTGIGVEFDWQVRIWIDPLDREDFDAPDHQRRFEASWVDPVIRDLDGDGRAELAVSIWTLDLGLALREPQLSHQVLVFRPEDDGGWQARAALADRRGYGVEDLESFAVVPAFPGDLDGDGRVDLLQSSGRGELEVRPLDLDAGKVAEPSLRMPVDALAALVRAQDLNGDGVVDLLVRKFGHWEIYLSRR